MKSNFFRQTSVAVLAFVVQTAVVRAQAVVQWVTVGGTSQQDALSAAAFGPNGELYAFGAFGYTDYPNLADTVMFKYDSAGQFVATQAARGEGIGVVITNSSRGYFLTGSVRDSDLLGMGRNFDFYLASYAANGTLLWERTAGTLKEFDRARLTDGQSGSGIALDAEGNIYVAGESIGPAVYGDKTFPNTVGGPLLCKFTPDGTLLWARRAEGQKLVAFGSTLPGGSANAIWLDPTGNVVISGSMIKGKAVFDDITINITATYDSGAFVAKYSPAGQIIWAKPIPFGNVAVDQQGNTLVSGPLNSGQASFDGISVSVADPSGYQTFIAKFNPAGGLLWAKAAPTGGLIVDRSGNIYTGSAKLNRAGDLLWTRTIPGAALTVRTLNDREEPVFTGTIKGTVDLDGHAVSSDTDGYDDYVICKADVNGKFQWAFSITSGNAEPRLSDGPFGYGIPSVLQGRNGDVFVFGAVRCPWSFAQQTFVCDAVGKFGEFPISVQMGGNNDIWLARISDPTPVLVELNAVRTASNLTLSWPASATGFVLESAEVLPAANWSAVPETPSVAGNQNVVTFTAGGGVKFYRLRKP